MTYVEDVDGVQRGGGPTSGCSDALVPPVPSGCKPDAQAGVEREVIADASAATAAGNAKT